MPNNYVYNELTTALSELAKRGYTYNFNIEGDGLHCIEAGQTLSPDEFEIKEFYRFEGMNNVDDSSVLYAIESRHSLKGVLVSAYGVYADSISQKLISKLELHH